MGARLGTVPGWERAPGWAPYDRVYEGTGPTIDIFPEYVGEEIIEYFVKFDIELFFCESPPISPVVRRTLRDTLIRQIWVTPLKEPIPNFERWIETETNNLARDVHRMSIIEMGGLRDCGMDPSDNYRITITERGFR